MGGSTNEGRTVSSDGSGNGYLEGTTLDDFFEGTEEPTYVLTTEKRGIKHEDGDGERVVEPGSGYSAVAAVTDERVLLLVGGNDGGTGQNRTVSLPYTEIRSVETKQGMLKSRLTLTARTSDRYTFWVSGREDLEHVAEYVEQAVSYWVTLDRRLEKAREHLATVEEKLDDGNPERARTAIDRTEELLDEAERVATDFRDGEHAMHRRIAQLETRLSLARIRTDWTRARNLAGEAEAARADGDYAEAHEAYRRSRAAYERAIDRSEGVEYQAADDMSAELADVEAAIEAVGAAPLDAATEACAAATGTDDPETAVDRWERALERCHEALVLTLRRDAFEGDPDALRFQVEWAAQKLVEAHRTVADAARERGESAREAGDGATAREAYGRARDHYESARQVAAEFRSCDPERFERALDELPETVDAETIDAAA
ncbi:MAG: PH domain-containing protein [Halorientalis sp.]